FEDRSACGVAAALPRRAPKCPQQNNLLNEGDRKRMGRDIIFSVCWRVLFPTLLWRTRVLEWLPKVISDHRRVQELPSPGSSHPLPSSDEGRGKGEGSLCAFDHRSHFGNLFWQLL